MLKECDNVAYFVCLNVHVICVRVSENAENYPNFSMT